MARSLASSPLPVGATEFARCHYVGTVVSLTIQRVEHVGIAVDDLAAATAFFVELGFKLLGEGPVEGGWVDRVVEHHEDSYRLWLCFDASSNEVTCAEETRMTNTTNPSATVTENPATLRLVWPQWQGASVEAVRTLFSEVPVEAARRGYAAGAAVLNAVLPAHAGPTAVVPVESGDLGLDKQDGIEAKDAVVTQLAGALEVIGCYHPPRILTLGGECSVSVAPFSWLAERYGDDLAVVWIDSHPDTGTPASQYSGYHAMAVAVLTGHGDPGVLRLLPATLDPGRVTLVGPHSWTEDDFPNVARWGIASFRPDDLRLSSQPLLDWLKMSGCPRVAIHFDVDVVDSNEIVLGLGAEADGLTSNDVRRLVADVSAVADVVGLTIAEFVPRQVIRLQQMLRDFPLI